MKRIHTGALVCFAMAMVLYFISWIPGVWAMAILGLVFEVFGWLYVLLGAEDEDLSPPRR